MIYLIADQPNTGLKIGFSTSPEKRLIGLQTGSPIKLRIITVIEGSREDEKFLHKMFSDLRLMGEWFQYDQRIIDFFNNPQPSPEPEMSFPFSGGHIGMAVYDDNQSFIDHCNHIGEAKLFGYIVATFNRKEKVWTYTTQKQKHIKELFGLEKSTCEAYLRNITKSGILIKIKPGHYMPSPEYVDYQ